MIPMLLLPVMLVGLVPLFTNALPAILKEILSLPILSLILTLLGLNLRLPPWETNLPDSFSALKAVLAILAAFVASSPFKVVVEEFSLRFPSPRWLPKNLPRILEWLAFRRHSISFDVISFPLITAFHFPSIVLLLVLALPAFARIPRNQMDPPSKIGLMTDDPYFWINWVKYCHNYPDFMCYQRPGNGWTTGDEAYWSISSCSDEYGLGTVRILFPDFHDEQNLENGEPQLNGVYHPTLEHLVLGAHVSLFTWEPTLRFQPGYNSHFQYSVPIEQWHMGLFVDFSGPPLVCFDFMLKRTIVWSKYPGSPPTYEHPVPRVTHTEL